MIDHPCPFEWKSLPTGVWWLKNAAPVFHDGFWYRSYAVHAWAKPLLAIANLYRKLSHA